MRCHTASSKLPLADVPVIALYGPTASGKTAVTEALLARLDAEAVSADSAAVYTGLPVLTAAPSFACRLVGTVPLTTEMTVGAYQTLAHAAIDEIVAAGRTAVVVGGTGLYLRAALSSLALPPPPAAGARERWEARYDELGPERAHGELAARDPAAGVRVHPNDRRRVVRALELAEAGSSLAPQTDRLWATDARWPTLAISLDLPLAELDVRITTRTRAMAAAGAAQEAKRAWAAPLSETARRVLGLEEFATRTEEEATAAVEQATRRLARYQRKWARRLSVAATLSGGRTPEEIADEIIALGRAGQHLSGR